MESKRENDQFSKDMTFDKREIIISHSLPLIQSTSFPWAPSTFQRMSSKDMIVNKTDNVCPQGVYSYFFSSQLFIFL